MALEWQPVYPGPTKRRWTARQAQFVPAQNYVPIPIPPPPTELTWHPTYPDRVRVRLRQPPALHQFLALWQGPPVADLRWLPSYPDTARRARLRPALQQAYANPNSGAILDIPIRGGWRPTYPDRAHRHKRFIEGGEVYPIQPLTILNGVGCIQFVDESVIASTLIDDALSTSTLIDESLTTSTLASEDLC